ncbi:hypothetical protein BD310DRAFT_928321 [Dichomitus squalens]|uniref:Uncharacterized protein n=1 Tax=Dichomitus squalens TaxID=114155 RepID=A0A4Q9PTX9_9APHY|nr:hypothetical protein BD310DRAFT_928321 [Dichomitus squalens]
MTLTCCTVIIGHPRMRTRNLSWSQSLPLRLALSIHTAGTCIRHYQDAVLGSIGPNSSPVAGDIERCREYVTLKTVYVSHPERASTVRLRSQSTTRDKQYIAGEEDPRRSTCAKVYRGTLRSRRGPPDCSLGSCSPARTTASPSCTSIP